MSDSTLRYFLLGALAALLFFAAVQALDTISLQSRESGAVVQAGKATDAFARGPMLSTAAP